MAILAPVLPAIDPALALQAVERIGQAWGLRKHDLPALLGRKPRTVRSWFDRAPAALDGDLLERVGHLLAIYNALHLIFEDAAFADSWVHRPNDAFDGKAPLDVLLSGSFTALVQTRQYLERAIRT